MLLAIYFEVVLIAWIIIGILALLALVHSDIGVDE